MAAPDDWRRQGQERWLPGRTWRFARYPADPPGGDHDHCEFCFTKISWQKGDINSAWVSSLAEDHRWVCAPCFADFRAEFAFRVEGPEPDASSPG